MFFTFDVQLAMLCLCRELVDDCPGLVFASETNGYPSYYLSLSKIIAEVKLGQLQSILKRRFGVEGTVPLQAPFKP